MKVPIAVNVLVLQQLGHQVQAHEVLNGLEPSQVRQCDALERDVYPEVKERPQRPFVVAKHDGNLDSLQQLNCPEDAATAHVWKSPHHVIR